MQACLMQCLGWEDAYILGSFLFPQKNLILKRSTQIQLSNIKSYFTNPDL